MTSGGEGFPGAVLAAAREALDISVNDVAESLNLPADVIEGIESGEYEGLPPVTFTRGYVRAYAKLLDLDADGLVSQFDATANMVDEAELVVAPTRRGIVDVSQGDPGRVMSVAVVVVLIAAAVALWWVWPDPEQGSPAEIAAPAQAETSPVASAVRPAVVAPTESVAAAPIAAAPAPIETEISSAEAAEPVRDTSPEAELTEREMPSRPRAAEPTQTIAAAEADSVQLVPQSASTTPEPEPSTAIAAISAIEAGSIDTSHLLTFSFSDDCWVEVQDKSGRNIYSDLNRPGQLLELTGEAPFRILLGYAPGVHLEYNGEPVALTPHTRNNVAQLVLGQ